MKYYCLGIKGTGMSALAQILYDLGNEVSGFDDLKEYKFTQDGLEKRNIPIYYDGTHAIDNDTIVTYSAAFGDDHPELMRVKKLGLKIKKYNELMGDIIDQFETIGVSGTHGKTTTSSIIKHILEKTVGCNYFIGAGDGYVSKSNKYYVVESDEFNRHFTAYHPVYAVITNIDAEHLECYKDLDDIIDTFSLFANQTKKLIVANGDNESVRKIVYHNIKFYGFNKENDVVIKDVHSNEKGSFFELYEKNHLLGEFFVPLYGNHMIMDATAAILICFNLGISYEDIYNNLLTFTNAKRRFSEEKIKDVIIIDDYAHHPTEIRATLEAAKEKYPNKKLIAVFMPNTYSRTKDFLQEFISSFHMADFTYLTEINSDREKQEDYPDISSHLIIDRLESADIIDENCIDKLLKYKDCVICFMSCAHIEELINKFKSCLENDQRDLS